MAGALVVMTFSYDTWVSTEAERVRTDIERLRAERLRTAAVFVLPSNGRKPGYLTVLQKKKVAGANLIHFSTGTNVMAVPSQDLYRLLWEACRREPVCPTVGAGRYLIDDRTKRLILVGDTVTTFRDEKATLVDIDPIRNRIKLRFEAEGDILGNDGEHFPSVIKAAFVGTTP